MTLYNIQKDVDDWADQFNPPYWPIHEQLARLVEETGEVAREINHLYGIKKKKSSEEKKQLEEELIDVLFTICCIANSENINLQAAWDRSMSEKHYGRDNQRFQRKENQP